MVMMTPSNFIMMLFRLASSLPTGLSSPPQRAVQKPKMMEKMMRGSMWDLLSSWLKSLTVRDSTISSAAVLASPISAAPSWMLVPAEGLKMLTQVRTHTPAMAPVMRNTAMVLPRILPRRFMFTMLPTAEAMDTNTRGTTMVNSRFRKMSPMGLSF